MSNSYQTSNARGSVIFKDTSDCVIFALIAGKASRRSALQFVPLGIWVPDIVDLEKSISSGIVASDARHYF